MEVKEEDEAKICRLCGQSDNFSIDVFSEDGTKRLLHVKIHSKINILRTLEKSPEIREELWNSGGLLILIDERDPLPKTICVHCVGKLEFVCDFQEECLRTQQLLRDRYNLPPLSDVITEEDGLPTAVCIKCIGALEFLCEFYDWCHRAQEVLAEKKKSTNYESDGSQFSTDESDKENVLPPKSQKRKLKGKVNSTEPAKKVSEQQLPEPETPEKIAVNKGINSPSVPSEKEISISSEKEVSLSSTKEVPISSETKVSLPSAKEVLVSSEKKVSISTEKEASVSFEKEVSISSQSKVSPSSEKEVSDSSRKETSVSSEKQIPNSLKKELYVTLDKLSVSVKNTSIVKKVVPLTKAAPVSLKSEIPKKKQDSGTPPSRLSIDKKQKEETRRSGDNKATTPLTTWLKGDSMSTKRKYSKVKTPKLSDSKYGKISELMTNEQKQAIENFYRVDMSVVDEIKVANNMTIHSRNEIECNICKQKYNRMDKCQVHIWRHLDMTPYFCVACKFSTLTVSNIRCHIRKSHLKIKPYVCHICEKKYTSPTALDEHINTHTGAKPHHCTLCDFSCSSRQILTNHYLIHKNLKDIVCDVCGKTFYSKARLRTHSFIHIKDSVFKCKYCSNYFMQEEALNKHYNAAHSKDYECNICNKTYKSKKALNNHQNVHLEAKYQCTLCPNRYKSQHILKEHLLKHKGVRKYKCNTCQKTFAQQSHLAAHMSVHIGIRYKCPGCKKGFNRHDNMKVHTKRCNVFLSNPELKGLFTTKVKTKTESLSSIESMMDTTSLSSRGSINSPHTNLVINKQVIAKVEPSSDSESSNDNDFFLYENEDENENSTDEVNAGEKMSVTENILSPDCF